MLLRRGRLLRRGLLVPGRGLLVPGRRLLVPVVDRLLRRGVLFATAGDHNQGGHGEKQGWDELLHATLSGFGRKNRRYPSLERAGVAFSFTRRLRNPKKLETRRRDRA
jgi:hypothetical protein